MTVTFLPPAPEDDWRPGDAPADVAAGPAFHPLANLFPMIAGQAFDDLAADIAANGLREPIILHQGRILDGRNRWAAAQAAGVALPLSSFRPFGWPRDRDVPEYVVRACLDGTPIPAPIHGLPTDFPVAGAPGDVVGYVLSTNLHRRHLTDSQRALIAARLEAMPEGRPSGKTAPIGAVSRGGAADMLHVGERSVTRARHVVDAGAVELQDAVAAGDVSIAAAAEIAGQPVERQAEILAELPRGDDGRLTPEARTAVRKLAGELRAEATAEKKQRRQEREVELGARQVALPTRRYGVIYADPEWRFEPYSRETGMDRAPENHYPTSDTLDIITRPVGSIAADDAVLFLWATAPMLPAALSVMEGWGFRYKTHVVWRKAELLPFGSRDPAKVDRGQASGAVVLGTGYWVRSAHELLLIGTRGNVPAPAMGTQFPSVIDAPPRRHSEKPERFAELIETYFPTLPKIELNRRGAPRPGWDAWGNEAELPPHDPETGEVLE